MISSLSLSLRTDRPLPSSFPIAPQHTHRTHIAHTHTAPPAAQQATHVALQWRKPPAPQSAPRAFQALPSAAPLRLSLSLSLQFKGLKRTAGDSDCTAEPPVSLFLEHRSGFATVAEGQRHLRGCRNVFQALLSRSFFSPALSPHTAQCSLTQRPFTATLLSIVGKEGEETEENAAGLRLQSHLQEVSRTFAPLPQYKSASVALATSVTLTARHSDSSTAIYHTKAPQLLLY